MNFLPRPFSIKYKTNLFDFLYGSWTLKKLYCGLGFSMKQEKEMKKSEVMTIYLVTFIDIVIFVVTSAFLSKVI